MQEPHPNSRFFTFLRQNGQKTLVSFGAIVYNVVYASDCVKIEGMRQVNSDRGSKTIWQIILQWTALR